MKNGNVKVGDKIRIIYMEGEPNYTNQIRTIKFIDDAGQLHFKEGGLAVIPRTDIYEVIK